MSNGREIEATIYLLFLFSLFSPIFQSSADSDFTLFATKFNNFVFHLFLRMEESLQNSQHLGEPFSSSSSFIISVPSTSRVQGEGNNEIGSNEASPQPEQPKIIRSSVNDAMVNRIDSIFR